MVGSSTRSGSKEALELEPRIYGPEEHGLDRSLIDPDAMKVVLRLVRAGYDAYIVGGGVRDLFLGKTPKDFDISTSATPKDVKNLFRNCRIIGRRFKLAHVYFANGKIIEVSTFRDTVEEWNEPGAENAEPSSEAGPLMRDNIYGTEETDAVRRDLTINGLFLDVSSFSIIDYVGGMEDLQAGIVRVIGDPDVRFREDPVRMMRVIRHSARNGFRIERSCWESVLRNRELLATSSQVRVFDELKKDLTSGHLLTILSLLADTRLLEQILPELLEHNAVHLTADSDFSRCIEAIDDMLANGEEVSPTVALAIIALFTAGSSLRLRDLAFEFADTGELVEKLGSTFTTLAVPRKERERISLVCTSWLKLKRANPQTTKPGFIKRSQLLPEIVTLMRITAETREDQQIVRIVERALEDGPADHEEQDRHGRRRHRGRRR